jgi:hypothetical protein
MVVLQRCAYAAAALALVSPVWATAPAAPMARSRADTEAARFCRAADFVGYSTIEPSGRRVEESFTWDDAQKAYIVRGPRLAYLLDNPGVAKIPEDELVPQTTFRIAIRADLSSPVDRFCQTGFQEAANCDPHGTIVYTQIYTGCDLQRLSHVIRITPDHAGSLPLLDLSFGDVNGEFSTPLYLSAGTDLRLNR